MCVRTSITAVHQHHKMITTEAAKVRLTKSIINGEDFGNCAAGFGKVDSSIGFVYVGVCDVGVVGFSIHVVHFSVHLRVTQLVCVIYVY